MYSQLSFSSQQHFVICLQFYLHVLNCTLSSSTNTYSHLSAASLLFPCPETSSQCYSTLFSMSLQLLLTCLQLILPSIYIFKVPSLLISQYFFTISVTFPLPFLLPCLKTSPLICRCHRSWGANLSYIPIVLFYLDLTLSSADIYLDSMFIILCTQLH